MAIKLKIKTLIKVNNNLTVAGALNIMNTSGIDVLVITNGDGRPIGLVTKDDLLNAIKRGVPANEKVDLIMRRTILTITGEEDPLQLLNMMVKNNINHLIVIDEKGEVNGVVSLKDVFETVRGMVFKELG